VVSPRPSHGTLSGLLAVSVCLSAVKNDATLNNRTWGLGREGQLGHGDRESKWIPSPVAPPPGWSDYGGWASNISCGSCHTAVVADNGDLYLWGKGENGCLGLGDDADVLTPSLNVTLHEVGVKVSHVACGHAQTCAVGDDGFVYSWGYGKTGTGYGSTTSSLVPVPVPPSLFGERKIARINRLPPLSALAFASVMHPRLGEKSVYGSLLPELVERIVKLAWYPSWPDGLPAEWHGIARLLGGV